MAPRLQQALEHEVVGDAVFAAGDAGETGAELVGAEVGEEAELTEVDAEDGRLAITHLAGGAEDGAVAAEHEDQVGGEAGQVHFLAEVVEDDLGVLAQERQQSFGLLGDAGTIAIAEDEDAHGSLRTSKRSFGVPIRKGRPLNMRQGTADKVLVRVVYHAADGCRTCRSGSRTTFSIRRSNMPPTSMCEHVTCRGNTD